MILLSWNVNGLRAVMQKGFMDFLGVEAPDLLGLQETKLQADQIPPVLLNPDAYRSYWSHADRKGYSGTALFSRIEPVSVSLEFGHPDFEGEGRVVRADFPKTTFYNVYFPNGQMNETRLQYKLRFYDRFLEQILVLRDQGRHVVICGDFNTAHKPIDLKNPKANENTSGFLPIERQWLDKLVEHGFVDTFRAFDDRPGQYSWWSYLGKARDRNTGWRIDYFFADKAFMPHVKRAFIRQDIFGSDHCPVGIETDDEPFR
jgi:exodeoxyribonuclease III